MKTKLLLTAICVAICAFSGIAQEIRITPKKITYERKGADLPEYKKTVEARYPRVSGITDPAIKATLDGTISYWKNFGITLKESLDDTWLSSLDYRTIYSKNGILSIELIMEGSGAYPSTAYKRLVVDLKTGNRIFLPQVFTNFEDLLVEIDRRQVLAVLHKKSELKEDGEDPTVLDDLIKTYRYSPSKIEEFSVDEAGVIFYFDYGFPHAVKALEPNSKYLFSWADLNAFIKRDGLLKKFIN